MKGWLKKYGLSFFIMVIGLHLLLISVRSITNRRELETVDYGFEITGIYLGIASLVVAFYEPLKANDKERIVNILAAISGGVMFFSWLIIMYVLGDSIDSFNTIMILMTSVFLLVIGVSRLLGASEMSMIMQNTILVILILALISVGTFLLTSGIL